MASVEVNGRVFDEYISAEKIAKCVKKVAERINTDYAGKKPLFICVLNGAFMYASDLFKQIELPTETSPPTWGKPGGKSGRRRCGAAADSGMPPGPAVCRAAASTTIGEAAAR